MKTVIVRITVEWIQSRSIALDRLLGAVGVAVPRIQGAHAEARGAGDGEVLELGNRVTDGGIFLRVASRSTGAAGAAGRRHSCLAVLAVIISWTSIRALGKQLRVHAGLYSDHELVRSGPYRIVRHPIYAGMLAMYLATALIRSAWPMALIGLAIFIAGTEIRVRIEDGLLASRFGKQFAEYKASVPAYIPFCALKREPPYFSVSMK